MKKYFLISFVIIISLICLQFVYAASVKLSWSEPTENSDGTPLTDLAGYKIYDNSVEVADVGNVLTHTLEITEGIHNFNVTAYDTSGNESDYSNTLIHDTSLNVSPAPPTNLRIE